MLRLHTHRNEIELALSSKHFEDYIEGAASSPRGGDLQINTVHDIYRYIDIAFFYCLFFGIEWHLRKSRLRRLGLPLVVSLLFRNFVLEF